MGMNQSLGKMSDQFRTEVEGVCMHLSTYLQQNDQGLCLYNYNNLPLKANYRQPDTKMN